MIDPYNTTAVRSSNIRAIGYHEGKGLIKIIFKKGNEYLYPADKETYNQLINAESVGSWFYNNIRNKIQPLKAQETDNV